MVQVWNSRIRFGEMLKELRSSGGLTLREVGELTGITFSLISAMEHGEKTVGADSAVKLADAFGLTGEERDEFLLKAAATRRRDKLVRDARDLPAELLNFLPQALRNAGVDVAAISACQLESPREQSEGALQGFNRTLAINLNDGKKLMCGLKLEWA
jgi:transcriptional regulator with XRE-family HTH domain